MSQKKNYLYKVGRQSAAEYFFLLGHCERMEILETLRRFGPTSFAGLLLNCPLSKSSLSRHIRILRLSGLVEVCSLSGESGYQLNSQAMLYALQCMRGYLGRLSVDADKGRAA